MWGNLRTLFVVLYIWAGASMLAGIVLFRGSLYVAALTGYRTGTALTFGSDLSNSLKSRPIHQKNDVVSA
jgi:hypothetical protein